MESLVCLPSDHVPKLPFISDFSWTDMIPRKSDLKCLDYQWLKNKSLDEQSYEALEIIETWLPQWNDGMRGELYKMLTGLDMGSNYGRAYLSRIEEIEKEVLEKHHQKLTDEIILISGAWCFYGSVLISLTETYQVRDLDSIFNFTSIYMLFDYWMDDPQISKEKKLSMIGKFCDIIQNPRRLSESSMLGILSDRLMRLIEMNKAVYSPLKDAFYSEMIASFLQHRKDLSLEYYLYLAEWKGGCTVRSIQSIVGVNPDDDGYLLGACFQLVDDIHDIEEDIAEGINTAATFIYKRDGHIDSLLFYAAHLINKLAPKYNIFKTCLLAMMMHSVAIVPYFSPEIVSELEDFFPLGKTTNIRSMMHEVFLQKLRGVHNTMKEE